MCLPAALTIPNQEQHDNAEAAGAAVGGPARAHRRHHAVVAAAVLRRRTRRHATRLRHRAQEDRRY